MRIWIPTLLVVAVTGLLPGCDKHEEVVGQPGVKAPPKKVTRPLVKVDPPPRVSVADSAKYNFGQMGQKTKQNHVFQVTNEGEGELQMRLADTRCGCTSVRIGDVTWIPKDMPSPPDDIFSVAPGGNLEIDVMWDAEERSGNFTTSVKVESNDPNMPLVDLAVEGEIMPYVELTENTLKLIAARNTEVTTTAFTIYSRMLDDLEIIEIIPSHEKVRTEVEPATESFMESVKAKRGYRCKVHIDPGLPIGPFSADMLVRTNCPQRPEITVKLSGNFAGDVSVNPARLDFGAVRGGESAKLIAMVKVRTDTPVEIKVGRRVPEFLKATVTPHETGKNLFKLTVEIPANAPGGELQQAGVELETTHPGCEFVKIPVRATIAMPSAGTNAVNP